ncbi:MAG: acylphosphatase [Bacteroidales bacterium]|nr:acylphosphatase [Bacteroidales bacterium]
MPCYKIHIKGSVFKTGFRYFLKEKAALNGITGKVYYENFSAVGITASGTEAGLKNFLEYCSIWNRYYHIDQVEISEVPPEEFSTFEVVDDIQDIFYE